MKRFKHIGFLALCVLIIACSQEKNTIVNRSYHNLTARYNGYFNGRLALQDAHKAMRESYKEDYTKLLPIFIYSKDEVVQPVYPQLERAIEKTSLVIDRHSMDINGKENCKWIDDTWIVMGEAQYLKRDFVQAKQIFDFTKRKYPDPQIEQQSRYWLARILTEEEQYVRAGDELRKLENSEGFPEKQLGDLYAFRAEYYLRQDRREEAIEALQKSVAVTKNRDEKTRRMFILAQLHKLVGDGATSSDLYAQVIKRHPEYEMAFFAKINRALAYDVTKGDVTEIRDILFKMLKDDKNNDYQDHIYYALAELELKENDEPEAIEYLKLATRNSVENGHTKGLAFYKLGQIAYSHEDYPAAQAYYDSTVAFLSPEHPDYQKILATANSLTQMMRDIETVEREDSLQALAQLSTEQQDKLIEQRIEDLIQDEKDAERQKELNELQAQAKQQNNNDNFGKNNSKGEWYFYNPTAIGFGTNEFKKNWGSRKNEDNWRRKDKTSVAPLLIADDGSLEALEDTTAEASDPKNPAYYRKFIPDTEEKMMRSDALIIEALYDLASVYKDQMHDDDMAINTYEDLISRYDSSRYHLNTYYTLYLMFKQAGNQPKSDYYKNLILSGFPETDYAKVILNPNYGAESTASTSMMQEVYSRAYTYFHEGYYRNAYDMATKALTEYPDNEYKPQFTFLVALCLGHIDSERRMIEELEKVAQVYGSMEVGAEARKILAYLKGDRKIETLEEAEAEAMSEVIEEKKRQYNYEMGAAHNFLIIVPDTADHVMLQSKVSDFNRKFFSTKGFKTSYIPMKEGKAMVVVSNIGFASTAMDYFNTFKNAGTDTEMFITRGYPRFVISYDNYATFFKDQVVEAYQGFFEEYYIKTE
ncbi:MAG: tetratricopeptide repeat protein [Flavobacteriales bacterium]